MIDGKFGCLLQNVGAYYTAGWMCVIKNNGLVSSPVNGYTFGNKVIGCYRESTYGGVFCDVRGEYNQIVGNNFCDCNTGIRIAGGNNTITGNNCSANSVGLWLEAGSNNGHGTVTGNTFNHNGDNLYCSGVTLGMSIVNNHLEFYCLLRRLAVVVLPGSLLHKVSRVCALQ